MATKKKKDKPQAQPQEDWRMVSCPDSQGVAQELSRMHDEGYKSYRLNAVGGGRYMIYVSFPPTGEKKTPKPEINWKV